ncbi:hypothetical protein EYF80_013888 [Liparis tanakae]|uniref:Uncharacterized protein n=1 Tax=Liparis tanakae TaxID=230148 RepID=A0A4Z2ID59_9TELE|nr:hypothetical protein EYF80_013888 [Liparis tanakae]
MGTLGYASLRGCAPPPCVAPREHAHALLYLRCHNASLLRRVCGRGAFAPPSPESDVRRVLTLGAVVRGPVQAARVARPLAGISVPPHSVGETRGKVFEPDLEHKAHRGRYTFWDPFSAFWWHLDSRISTPVPVMNLAPLFVSGVIKVLKDASRSFTAPLIDASGPLLMHRAPTSFKSPRC